MIRVDTQRGPLVGLLVGVERPEPNFVDHPNDFVVLAVEPLPNPKG